MSIWQADFYRRPLQDEQGHALWELLICNSDRTLSFQAFCPQSTISAQWVTEQFQAAAVTAGQLPQHVQVFRPQSLSLIEAACQNLGIELEPTRHTPALKTWLQERAQEYQHMSYYTGQPYDAIAIEKLPPIPLPENLWGEQWRFASLSVSELDRFRDRPIPILEMRDRLLPFNLGLASTVPIPGVVIDAGRRSMQLARWLKSGNPVSLSFIPGAPDGLILETGLQDRWVVATFEDPEVRSAAQVYQTRKQTTQGLHFLLVEPDDSGMTYSGFWLLQDL